MNQKEYEPDEDYKELAESLVEMIKKRDEHAELLKFAAPEDLPEARKLLAEMDQSIEEFEASLAEAYQIYQQFRSADEKVEQSSKLLLNKLEMMFIFCKHVLPEKFKPLETKMLNSMSPEDREAFLDRIAVREINELNKIIVEMTGNKDWREAVKALENLS